jgi:transposase InsO family protein
MRHYPGASCKSEGIFEGILPVGDGVIPHGTAGGYDQGGKGPRPARHCSYDYQKKLQAHGLRPSISGKRNCYDNVSVETFFKSLKAELIWRQSRLAPRQAEAASFQYINRFYNTRRRHPYLGGINPLSFEAKVAECDR